MTDSDFFELANRVIDGVESDQDREALNTVIGQSLPRRLEFEQLSAVASILDAVRPVEPPEGLRNRILAAIPRERSLSTTPKRLSPSSIWGQIKDFTSGRPVYGLAYATVVGIFVGVIGLVAILGTPGIADSSETVGTMAARGESFSKLDQASIAIRGVQASSELSVRESEFVIQVTVESTDRLEVVVTPISEVTTWYGVELDGGARLTGAILEPNELRFPTEGRSMLRVSGLQGGLNGVHCTISVEKDGEVLGEMTLSSMTGRAQ